MAAKTRFLALWVVAVLATGAAFVAYLALRFETVRLGYELDRESQENKRLGELRRMLVVEAQSLRERQRVVAIAERSLGMAAPDKSRIIAVEPRAAAREQELGNSVLARVSAGRAR